MYSIIVAGSRSITNIDHVKEGICFALVHWLIANPLQHINFSGIEIVSGGAKGVDTLGAQLASDSNIPLVIFKADWEKYGKKAGILRNIQMGDYAHALIAIWDGKSSGTNHMINYMKKLNKPVYVHTLHPA